MPPRTSFPRRLHIVNRQADQLRRLVDAVVGSNPFYTRKLENHGVPYRIRSLDEFIEAVPLTTKQELVDDQQQHPPYGTNLTFPVERFTRCHHTSGTLGRPLRWLDTPESWDVMVNNWADIFRAAETTAADRVFFAFSFGPFIGFWMAFESAGRLGCLCLTGGGMTTRVRLQQIFEQQATVLCCTPSYAIHLAETAAREGFDMARSAVRLLLVAGEPGGSIPATRELISSLWRGARVFDHHGMTEVGPVTYECPVRPGVLHVIEDSYLTEVIDPTTLKPVAYGETGELVLTPLFRIGMPLLRYRTGDLVKAPNGEVCECGRWEAALEGGILGRADDMVVIRGVNIFPTALEEIIRRTGGVAEFRVTIDQTQPMTELRLEVEPADSSGDQVALRVMQACAENLNLRVPVTAVPSGTLPRFEAKARRWQRITH